jgi:hypothetical protein
MGLTAGTIERLEVAALNRYPLKVTPLVPEGHFIIADYGGTAIHVGPVTAFRVAHNGRYPFETRYCRGMSELRRERRLRNRERTQ